MIYFISDEDFDKVFADANVNITFAKNKKINIPILTKKDNIALMKLPSNIFRDPYDFYSVDDTYYKIKTSNNILFLGDNDEFINKIKSYVEKNKFSKVKQLIKNDFYERIKIGTNSLNFNGTPYELGIDKETFDSDFY